MQFSVVLLGFFTALAAAQIPSADSQCSEKSRLGCAASSDGVRRCLVKDGVELCVVDCDTQNSCTPGCTGQGFSNGFCTTGAHPCLCSNADPGFSA
ncbi:putative biotrophy-associated secreted protein 3 protein [Botryosphaeria dothidea]|uniref:Biotrophy-associated secreted protein 3 protein n=1 Tax=Botryosphaeria dothidea TaxID=55169 RepID=A0A8H4ILJ9_9PEZI|nr:putative biotrophy-associated secreted protein 3 protein [Botryosphaeria dothidea]